ncbi:MAG: M48 family metallopeptidase [Fimbriimonadaceae bacterium]
MRRTLLQQQAANSRASIFLGIVLMAVLGALGTAIVGFYSPDDWVFGLIGAVALGLVVALVAWYAGPKIVLSMSHARAATPQEDQVLSNVVDEMAIAAGLRRPKVYVIDDPSPNAFATGRDPSEGIIVVTTGLLVKLNREELQGVIAHEMAHIRNLDIKFMTTIALVAGLIPLIADVFLRSLWRGGRRSKDSGNAIFLIIAIALAVLAPICAMLIKLAVSRKREFLADATAAQLTRNPEGLAQALIKITQDPGELEEANRATEHMYIVNPFRARRNIASALWSTHPPVEERVRALRGLHGSTAERHLASGME